MSKSILLLLCFLPVLGFAQGQEGAAASAPRTSQVAEHCATILEPQEGATPTAASAEVRANCEALAYAATTQKAAALRLPPEIITSIDRRITCIRRAAYTVDFKHCRDGMVLYNSMLNAEKIFLAAQQFSLQNRQKSIAEEATRRTAEGDGQVAAIDASNAHGAHVKGLNLQQRDAYAAAVTAFTGFTVGWPGAKTPCFRLQKPAITECEEKMTRAMSYSGPEVIANKQAQAIFAAIAGEYAQKGITAHFAAKAFEEQPHPNQEDPFGEDGHPQLDRCIQFPNDPACRRPTSNQGGAGPGIEQVSWSFGGDGGSNELGSAADPANFGEEGAEGIAANGERITNLDSPFLDEAREASGILNPAAAASPGAGGGGASPGGGGGGAGGGGGGGGGLPGDLKGIADDKDNKEAEIKSNKFTGKYVQGAGEGFKGIKEKKEEFKNPFDDLVKSKDVEGGVEEDRSIAADTGGPSDLFMKISRRYGMVFEDKRLEVSTLE